MAIRFRCSHCNQLLSIATRMAGKAIKCPACKQPTSVPVPEEELAPAPAAAAPAPKVAISAEQLRNELESREDDAPDSQAQLSSVGLPLWAASPESQEAGDDEPLRLKRRVQEMEEMDLTPMVDVTFLLLIFFMITASFSVQKTLDVPPPESESQGARQTVQTLDEMLNESLKIEIDEKNALLLDDEPVSGDDDLAGALQQRMRSGQKAELLIIASAEAFHETVVKVVDAANAAGMQKVRLTTRGGTELE